MNMISCFSSSIFISVLTISIPNKKALVHRHATINGRTVRTPAHSTPRAPLRSSVAALMVDETSRDDRQIKPIFSPCKWGYTFSTFYFDEQAQHKYSEEIEKLKKDVITMLMAATSTKLIMILIDKLERLGLAYHFEVEIEEKLKQVCDFDSEEEKDDYDMFTTALGFRLLRQHQYHVSCKDTFEKFVDKDNKLKLESLSSDVEGLLSLYEAAHVRIHDENILEEAVTFTTSHLTRMLPQLESPLKEEVQLAMRFPLHKTPTIITIHSYIDIYEDDHSRDEIVLRLAKLNFNFMQNIFRNELFQLSKWWNKLKTTSKVAYFRDRLPECYLWALSFHFEPQYSHIRTLMTKLLMYFAVLDDTHDTSYATVEEITLFTQSIERWNIEEINQLPDYLKWAYKLIMSITEEFECEAQKHGKSYVIPYYIEAVKQLGRGYGQEQKWIMEKQMPSFEEYMANSRITTLMYVSLIASLSVIKSGTQETIDWVLSDCEILTASSDIIRITDDLQDVTRCENEAGAILAYMKETGASMQETRSKFKELFEDRWKDLTAEWVNRSMVPKEIILVLFVDITRMCEIYYMDNEDNLVPILTALLLDPTILV